MIRSFVLSLVLTIPLFAAAGSDAPTMACVTEYPTTSMVLAPVPNKDVMSLRIYHHNGTDYMPIHEGVIVPNDLSILADRATMLKPLGTDLSFEFPKSGCKTFDERVFQCNNYGAIPVDINGHQVAALSVFSSALTEVSFVGTYKYVQLTVFMEIDKKTVFVPMRYMEHECSSNLAKVGSLRR